MTAEKIEINRANAQHSTGPKTEEGKAKSKLNAQIHGILANVFNGEDEKFIEAAKKKLEENPQAAFKEFLLERIATWYLRLQRARLFEREFLQSKLDPPQWEGNDALDLSFLHKGRLVNKGHTETVSSEALDRLTDTVVRYEITAENRLLKCIQLLKELELL